MFKILEHLPKFSERRVFNVSVATINTPPGGLEFLWIGFVRHELFSLFYHSVLIGLYCFSVLMCSIR